ncbi:MAG: ArsR family transcriptional regulator [Actinobacteria bacterium HGW-Actinobacteria-2]|nr:MAG: ArsR family transcriptional regulator [Actinobacteria bacterium HGW-Actinobacteria-2]
MSTADRQGRAQAYAALGDPVRLHIVDLLAHDDLSPKQLAGAVDLPTNLLAHHLQTLERAGLIERHHSEGDRRRTYVTRTAACERLVGLPSINPPDAVAFVCSHNSARSQLAEAYWRTVSSLPVTSAGTDPAAAVHPLAVATGRRHGLDLSAAQPKLIDQALTGGELVVSVCDLAHESIGDTDLHWSIPDPAARADEDAFEAAFVELVARIDRLTSAISSAKR